MNLNHELIQKILEAKWLKKTKKELKEEVVKSLEKIVMEGVENRIENAIDNAKLQPSSSNESVAIPELEKSFSAKLDETAQTANDLAGKVEDLVETVTKLSENQTSTTKTVEVWQQWRDSGVISSKEDWMVALWGLACIQVRFEYRVIIIKPF